MRLRNVTNKTIFVSFKGIKSTRLQPGETTVDLPGSVYFNRIVQQYIRGGKLVALMTTEETATVINPADTKDIVIPTNPEPGADEKGDTNPEDPAGPGNTEGPGEGDTNPEGPVNPEPGADAKGEGEEPIIPEKGNTVDVNLDELTVAELRDLAKAKGITIPAKATKAAIIEALNN